MGYKPFDSTKMFEDAKSMASGFTVGTATSTNVVDMGTDKGDEVSPAEVVVVVESPTSASGNTGTMQVVLQDSADGSTGWATIQSGHVSNANAANIAPDRFYVPPDHKRYLRLQFVIGTANFTAGTLHAGVV